MARRPYPFQYVDIHGRPFGSFGAAKPRPNSAADQPREEKKPPVAPSAADLERVFDAVVLASWRRGKTALTTLLRALQWRRERGGSFDGADVGAALRRLVVDGRAQALEDEGWSVPAPAAEARLAELLQQPEAMGWWRVWLWVADGANGPIERLPYYFSPRNDDESAALLRLVLISGVDGPGFDQLCSGPLRSVFVIGPLSSAVAQLLHLQLTARVNPALWWRLLSSLDQHGMLARQAALRDWIEANLHAAPPGNATSLRLRVAEQRLHRGDTAGVQQAIADDAAAANFLPLMQALLPAHAGRFADTVAAFPPAWKALTSLLGRRRGFAPMSLLQWYPLALMAQPAAAAWTAARKFCVAASGSRNPPADDDWGRWAHVLAVRLGDERLQPAVLMPDPPDRQLSRAPDRLADRLVLAAWLGQRSAAWTLAQSQALLGALCDAGLPWKADLVLQACVQLGGPVPARPDGAPPPWPVAYFSKRQDAWREALAAIVALGDGRSASVDKPLETLRWLLTLDDDGRVSDLRAFEPAATARGKPKLLTLLQLKKRNRLDPRDAAVARCLRQGRYRANELSLDLVQAAMALQGHPALAFHDAPDVAVELVESLPVLEVRRERAAGAEGEERFVFRLHDALHVAADPALEHHLPDYDQIDAEVERRNGLRVVRDAPDRARLLRVTPAQRRVAELVAQGWTVPADAGAELDAALRVLSGHFMLHSDAAAGEAVPSDARLVAQLQPRGDALRLTLAVRPFGDFGPQLAPGHGRVRLMTLRAGVSLATERALPTEREHLATVPSR